MVEALGDVLVQPLADTMAPEVVAVPTRGVERWLSQRLAHRLGVGRGDGDGVCANIGFPFPGSLIATATTAVCGPAPLAPAGDPWAPDNCVWPLLELVDEHIGDELLWPLAEHLRASSPSGDGHRPRRFTAVRRLADLYDRYAVHRPEMVLAWHEQTGRAQPAARPMDVAWQAELWRLLRQRLAVPSPAERFAAAPALIAAAPERLDFPERISLFGLTRLPASYLQVLKAVAAHRDVHLFLLHPSGALWDTVAPAASQLPVGMLRSEDGTARLPRNPLLRSWGRDAREMQLVLAAQGIAGGEHRPVEEEPSTLLGLLQADIRADRQPPGPPRVGDEDARPVLADGDRSVQVHSCHGRARQVEVVREAVLHLLAQDTTLEPRDVIIMCPDIELFAPLIQASFGVADLAGAPPLRARLADRSLRQTNPLLGVAAHLLELAGSRVTAAQVLDLASRPPVGRRFGFGQDELSQIERWLAGTGVRWGLDGPHRAPWKLTDLDLGTWRAGLDRLLLGVAMADDGQRLFGATLPYGDLATGDIGLVGRLAELVERLGGALDRLQVRQPPGRWAEALLAGTEALATPDPDEGWQAEQLGRALGDLARQAHEAFGPGPGPGVELDLSEARSLLGDRLRGRPTRANFRTGDMTICTLVPMRSVPHRVVCLLGLDDGQFPRPGAPGGDDLLTAAPQVGDPDVPGEDRQLLLDALLAAAEHLVITYEGRDQHLNQRRPPSVPVAELLDVVDRTVRLDDPGRQARQAVLVQHPLQPFDPANFEPGALGPQAPWRFDDAQLEGARALAGTRSALPPFLTSRLPARPELIVQLASLVRFLEYPVRAFLRERLGLYAGDLPDQLLGSLPIEMAPLERWALGDRLLDARLGGASLDRACEAERGRGLLPPGALGDAALAEVIAVVEALVEEVGRLPFAGAPTGPVEVKVDLPDGGSLVGTVPGVCQGTVLRCTYSKLRPKHRLRAWAQFLALSAAYPGTTVGALTIGQAEGSNGRRPRVSSATLAQLSTDAGRARAAAVAQLEVLVDLYRRGMREPLPVYCATSAAWASAAHSGQNPVAPARERWASASEDFPGEDAEPEHVVVLGRDYPFDELMAALPAPDETGDGWAMSEPKRLGRLAARLWRPLLDHEVKRER